MANKMTKAMWYEALANYISESDFEDKEGAVEFLNHEKELLQSRSGSRKPTAVQKTNIGLKDTIKEVLANTNKPMTVTELVAAIPSYDGLKGETLTQDVVMTNQKMSALLRQLVKAGEVVRVEEKKKAYFALG